ncbi:MAG: 4-alpha-glucanotransferase [Propionibacteriaceae bacterium]|jgi:4-alpha-glucanotransferase|nr:4-alpha-glucanotransferase [Propionibacteriaceae bacterium]
MEPGSYLAQLAEEFSLATEFWNFNGERIVPSDEAIIGILAGFGVDASDDEKAAAALEERHNATWTRTLPPCIVQTRGTSWRVYVHVPHGNWVYLTVITEDGNYWQIPQVDHLVPPRMIRGNLIGEAAFDLPGDLPVGYHRLQATTETGVHETPLIVSPRTLGRPRALGRNRAWGYSAQLYSVLSEDSWNFGDLQDLIDLSVWAGGQAGADYILVNPLQSGAPMPPVEDSPYLPVSRRFLNLLYIRPESIPEYAELTEKERAKIASIKAKLAASLKGVDEIERDVVIVSKVEALRIVFAHKLRPARQVALNNFIAREGDDLKRFSRWCALAVEYDVDWREWPEEYQQVDSEAVEAFAAEHDDEVRFYMWLQWVADGQLLEAQSRAVDAGMRLGLLTDLPVGVGVKSAEYWANPDIFAKGVTIGAPPDYFNHKGQEWGQLPWRPDRLEELGYEPFKQMIRTLMRNSGGVRIDHVMGMFRLWWIPKGFEAAQGTYVRYNHEAMVGILCLEAHRAGALVVGEDLGVVEPWVRQYLADRGILGTSVVWFENYDDGTPKAAETWREACMASVTTHDMPPTEGYLKLDHVRLQHKLGLLDGNLDDELAQAKGEQERLLRILRERGFLTGAETETEEVVLALYKYLTLTPCQLLQVALPDAVGDRRTQNQPGTYHEYPNWRMPLSNSAGELETLEKLFTDERAERLAKLMRDSIPKRP